MALESGVVSGAALTAMVVTLLVTLVLPIVLYFVYAIRNKGAGIWSAWWIGALGFFVPQILIRLPVLNLLSISEAFVAFAERNYIVYSLLLALSAALFETAGRYGAARLLSRKGLTLKKAAAAGLGHGGIESMLILGLTSLNNLLYAVMINSGAYGLLAEQTAAAGGDAAALMATAAALIQTSPVIFLLAGYERILTMIIHLALSLLICRGIYRGRTKDCLLWAVAFHTALDFFVPLLTALGRPTLGNVLGEWPALILAYGLLTAMAAVGIIMIVRICRRWKGEERREDLRD